MASRLVMTNGVELDEVKRAGLGAIWLLRTGFPICWTHVMALHTFMVRRHLLWKNPRVRIAAPN